MKKRALLLPLFILLYISGGVLWAQTWTVSHVSDGDTLVLDDGQKVRLIGVDTPEMSDMSRNRQSAVRYHVSADTVRQFAVKAKEFSREQVEGRQVRLEYDWQHSDKYGRTLAYVYREPDGLFLNAELLRQGYAFAYRVFPFKYLEQFSEYSQEAQTQKKGLWK